MALWREAFSALTWVEFMELPAEQVQKSVTYLKTRAEVEKAKAEIKGGRT